MRHALSSLGCTTACREYPSHSSATCRKKAAGKVLIMIGLVALLFCGVPTLSLPEPWSRSCIVYAMYHPAQLGGPRRRALCHISPPPPSAACCCWQGVIVEHSILCSTVSLWMLGPGQLALDPLKIVPRLTALDSLARAQRTVRGNGRCHSVPVVMLPSSTLSWLLFG